MLDKPDSIGRGLSFGLTTVLYSLSFIAALTVPFRTGLEKELKQSDSPE